MLDRAAITTQAIYSQNVDTINDKIPGKNFADKINHLLDFYQNTHGKTYDKMITEDIDKIITNKLKKLGII